MRVFFLSQVYFTGVEDIDMQYSTIVGDVVLEQPLRFNLSSASPGVANWSQWIWTQVSPGSSTYTEVPLRVTARQGRSQLSRRL